MFFEPGLKSCWQDNNNEKDIKAKFIYLFIKYKTANQQYCCYHSIDSFYIDIIGIVRIKNIVITNYFVCVVF